MNSPFLVRGSGILRGLLDKIMNRTRERVDAGPSNFGQELSAADSDLAEQTTKNCLAPGVVEILDPLTG